MTYNELLVSLREHDLPYRVLNEVTERNPGEEVLVVIVEVQGKVPTDIFCEKSLIVSETEDGATRFWF